MKSTILFLLLIFILFSCSDKRQVILFHEDFSVTEPGPLSVHMGAHTEYHYLKETAPKGHWTVSNYRGWWDVREKDGKRYIYQKSVDKEEYTHPMIITGSEFWKDYNVSASFIPESAKYRCGAVFRYQNDRCYYFAGVEKDRAVIKLVNHATGFHKPYEAVLDEEPLNWKPGEKIGVDIKITGNLIIAEINGKIKLQSSDSTFQKGKIGLTADVPARFMSVKVTSSPSEKNRFEKERREFINKEKELQSANPKPVVWKKIDTKGFGVGRNLRFGDLNGDGTIDVLIGQVLHHGPKDRNSELSCLTAITFEGEKLWQKGKPDLWKDKLTNDVAFQIHDIDRDGKNEVIYCMNQEIVVADGATGRVKYKSPTPKTPSDMPQKSEHNIFPRILGDCLYFGDLQGKGYDSDIILKDRYRYIWVFDNELNLLWKESCNTGHYPYAYDIDNDGKDELMMGYTLFDHDGKKLWSLDNRIKDHADGVAILRFAPGTDLKMLCAASDEGIFFTDMEGNILKHHYLGHVQNPAIANFRDDMPGLETVSINFWKNQGIVNYYDAQGEVYHSFEPNQYGSMCLPINWTGKSEEFFVHNPNVKEGGMFDGWGRKAVTFPADGHPDMCNAVMDITGDCRDEVVVWDPYEIWVYTQDDNPKTEKLYRPERNPLYNYSNYQATVSLPGWSE